MKRYDALQVLASLAASEDLFVTSVGTIKDEWYSLMPGPGTLFLSLMGGTIPCALGMAVALPHRRVVALDTDGSCLMNPGALCTVANEAPANLTVLVFDNGIYEGAGQIPTHTSRGTDLERVAQGCGLRLTATVGDTDALRTRLLALFDAPEPGFLRLRIEPGVFNAYPPGTRKRSDGAEDKYRFIRHIEQLEGIVIKEQFVRS